MFADQTGVSKLKGFHVAYTPVMVALSVCLLLSAAPIFAVALLRTLFTRRTDDSASIRPAGLPSLLAEVGKKPDNSRIKAG